MMHQDFLKWPVGAADVDSEMHQPPALDPSVSLTEYAEATVRAPEPVGRTLRVLAERSFTGEAEFAIDGGVLVYFDAGHAYFAERAGDRPLGERLVAAGVVPPSDLRDGMIRIGDVEHLGRLFDRVPGVDRDAVIAVTERITDGVLSEIASQHAAVGIIAYRHHRSGVHRWFVGPGHAAPLRPLSEVTQLDLSVVEQLPDLSVPARSVRQTEVDPVPEAAPAAGLDTSPFEAPAAAFGTPELRIEWSEPGPIGFAAPSVPGPSDPDPFVVEPPPATTDGAVQPAPALPPPPAAMPPPIAPAPALPVVDPRSTTTEAEPSIGAAAVEPPIGSSAEPAEVTPMALRLPEPPAPEPAALEPPAPEVLASDPAAFEPPAPVSPEPGEPTDLASPTLEALPQLELQPQPIESATPTLAPAPVPEPEPAAPLESEVGAAGAWALFDPETLPAAEPLDEPEPIEPEPEAFRIVWPDGSQQVTDASDEPDLGVPLLPAAPAPSATREPVPPQDLDEAPRDDVPDEVADAVRRALAAIERASSEPNTPRLRVGSVDLPDVAMPKLLDRSVVEPAAPADHRPTQGAAPTVPQPAAGGGPASVPSVSSLPVAGRDDVAARPESPAPAPTPAFAPPAANTAAEAMYAHAAAEQPEPIEKSVPDDAPLPEPGQLSVVFVDETEADEERKGALRRLIGSLRRK